jgi:hypothetical protein
MYGPTETTVWSTVLEASSNRSAAPSPIGRPDCQHAGATSSMRTGSLCRWGWRGDLYIGGDGVALGYLNRPELDRRALRARSLCGAARRAAVPHGRPGPLPARRQHRVPGPRRPPGEGARLPDRAGRDRGGIWASIRQVEQCVVVAARMTARRQAAGGLPRPRGQPPISGRLARAPAPSAARLHGAAALRPDRRDPADCPTARSTGARCPPRPNRRRAWKRPTSRRAARLRRSLPRSAPECWGWTGWASNIVSSTWAATRCSPPA